MSLDQKNIVVRSHVDISEDLQDDLIKKLSRFDKDLTIQRLKNEDRINAADIDYLSVSLAIISIYIAKPIITAFISGFFDEDKIKELGQKTRSSLFKTLKDLFLELKTQKIYKITSSSKAKELLEMKKKGIKIEEESECHLPLISIYFEIEDTPSTQVVLQFIFPSMKSENYDNAIDTMLEITKERNDQNSIDCQSTNVPSGISYNHRIYKIPQSTSNRESIIIETYIYESANNRWELQDFT